MWVFKTLYLIPEGINLLKAVFSNFAYWWAVINLFAIYENRFEKFLCSKIGNGFRLPHVILVKDFKRLCIVDCFVVNTNLVSDSLSCFVIKKSVNLFKMWVCNLTDIFADFDFRNDFSVIFNCNKLINPTKNRITFCSYKSFAYAEGIDFCTLKHKVTDNIFIKRI